MGENKSEGYEINLKDCFYVILRQKWIILLVSIVVALSTFIYVNMKATSYYTAKATIYILDNDKKLNMADLQLSNQLTYDYELLIKSDIVTEAVIDRMSLNMSPAALASKIWVTAKENTHVIVISVGDSDPYFARDIANMVYEVAAEKMVDVMNIDAVKLISPARIPTAKSGSNTTRTTLIAFMLTFVVSCMIAVFIDTVSDRIKNPDDVTKEFGLSTLGSIPNMKLSKVHSKKGDDK